MKRARSQLLKGSSVYHFWPLQKITLRRTPLFLVSSESDIFWLSPTGTNLAKENFSLMIFRPRQIRRWVQRLWKQIVSGIHMPVAEDVSQACVLCFSPWPIENIWRSSGIGCLPLLSQYLGYGNDLISSFWCVFHYSQWLKHKQFLTNPWYLNSKALIPILMSSWGLHDVSNIIAWSASSLIYGRCMKNICYGQGQARSRSLDGLIFFWISALKRSVSHQPLIFWLAQLV
jgi:hypothetical protein